MSASDGATSKGEWNIYKEFERELNIKIPEQLQNLLIACGYDNIFSLRNFQNHEMLMLEEQAKANARYHALTYLCNNTRQRFLLPAYKKLINVISQHASLKLPSFTMLEKLQLK